jgi:hypothetical protein
MKNKKVESFFLNLRETGGSKTKVVWGTFFSAYDLLQDW